MKEVLKTARYVLREHTKMKWEPQAASPVPRAPIPLPRGPSNAAQPVMHRLRTASRASLVLSSIWTQASVRVSELDREPDRFSYQVFRLSNWEK